MSSSQLTLEQASAFAQLPLRCLRQEFPNVLGHVMNEPSDVKSPRELHPAFYGCFDWHSSVHGHWMLVRLLRLFDLPNAGQIRAVLAENLSPANIHAEVAYLSQPNRGSFERTYGWAWLLKLAEELHGAEDADMRAWSKSLRPLEHAFVDRYHAFLPKQTYPIRIGTHGNTAFGLAFALDYAKAVGNEDLRDLLRHTAWAYFADDSDYPTGIEPGGADFFSPSLMEADLMRRVMSQNEFGEWFNRFLPNLKSRASLLNPVHVSDRTDPQIAHLDGLNLSRAWCMRQIAAALPEGPSKRLLAQSAEKHAAEGLAHVATGDYAGEHWLASFAVYLMT